MTLSSADVPPAPAAPGPSASGPGASASAAPDATFRAMAEAMPQLVWSTRPDGYHDYFNERWYAYTGMPRPGEPGGDDQGWQWGDYLHPDDVARTAEVWRHSLATGALYEVEYRFKEAATGRYRWFLGRAVPLRGAAGAITRWFGTCTDVESAKRAELRLAEQARELEAANAAKSLFLATMSHELRTPLNAIGGYAELLALGLHGPVTPPQREVLERIQRSQQHLLGLITSVLNFARLEAGRVEYRLAPVPVADVVREVGRLMEPLAAERALAYAAAGEPGVVARADREKLAQVLVNLLSNAVKFTEPGGRIDVTWGKEPNGADGARAFVRVRDTGRGITAEKLAAVFEPFVQADVGRTRQHEGAGLGLAISRDLARGMGGELAAESAVGRGSTFTLTLPLA